MKTYTSIEIRTIDLVAEASMLQSSIKVQKFNVKVDEYQAMPEETFDFNFDSFGDTSFE